VFETGALLLLALVLAAVAPTLRDALLSSLTLAGCAALVPVVAGPGLVPVVTTEFFLVPGLAIACLLVRLREQADRSAWALRHELEAERERLAHLACTDALTGVHNRRSFMDRLAAAASLGARHGRPVSVLLLDVDHFKAINDTHGHPVGDSTLRALAATCLRSLRDGDCVGRLGGEEFAVLLPETDGAGAVVIGERLRAALARTEVPASGVRLRFTVSVGVASLDAAADDAEKLLHRADEALYAAKRGGRNRVKAA
jgi:diguanylate cyclase (GGDEF)-like protein